MRILFGAFHVRVFGAFGFCYCDCSRLIDPSRSAFYFKIFLSLSLSLPLIFAFLPCVLLVFMGHTDGDGACQLV